MTRMGIEGGTKKAFPDRCLQFAFAVIALIRQMPPNVQHGSGARQLEKSATSIGANIAESKSAQSRADFISKFEIALKEARETDYWLRLMKHTGSAREDDIGKLIGECWQLTAILVASIKTAKRNGGIEEPRLQKERAESREQN
jgi:four helix bundle protein